MAIKYTIQGLLIYVTIAAYLLAFVATLLRRFCRAGFTCPEQSRRTPPNLAPQLVRRPCGGFIGGLRSPALLFFAAFALGCIGVAYRWLHVGHIPMQNLFEVFLCLGALVYPISIFCNRVLRVGGALADILIGAIVLFPAGFFLSAEPQQLPPALQSWLFAPHVFVYMLSYVLMTKAAVQAVLQLAGTQKTGELVELEQATYRMVCAGFPLLTLGLILGSVWGRLAWGDWWGWDPKELWSLASWLVYVGYLHFRYMFGKKHARFNSLWVIAGLFVIIITLLWVNLSKLFPGLHSYAM